MNIGDDAMLVSFNQSATGYKQGKGVTIEGLLIMSVVISTVNFLNYWCSQCRPPWHFKTFCSPKH